MRTLLVFAFSISVALACPFAVFGQDGTSIPTLIVPTLVPTQTSSGQIDTIDSRSAVADIVASGSFRVGVLYNDPPYSALNQQGALQGLDIELLRLIAEVWDVELVLTQVTRQNALDRLNSRSVDAVASAFVRYRALDALVEFSQTYLTGRQALMVRADSDYTTIQSLLGSRMGYVIGTRAEAALRIWEERLGFSLNSQFYLTLDQAFGALSSGEIEAVLGEAQALQRVTRPYPGAVRILEEAVLVEPHAIALRRQDADMRNLLNRTLQYLAEDGQLEILYGEYFPGQEYPPDTLHLWEGIRAAPNPAQFSGENRYPAQTTIPRLLQSGRLRVGGLSQDADSGSESQRRLNELNRSLVDEIARRWNVTVEAVSGDEAAAVEMLKNGNIDLIVGMRPDWEQAKALDFAGLYLLHGDRLMVPVNSRIEGFNDLRGQWIGVLFDDETARERAQAWADSINASVNFIHTPAASAALTLLELDNADAIYADSLSLIPHLEASPSALRLTDRWYSRSYFGFGLLYNDIDFRLLLDYTIQELFADGTLQTLTARLLPGGDTTNVHSVPGSLSFAGFTLSGA